MCRPLSVRITCPRRIASPLRLGGAASFLPVLLAQVFDQEADEEVGQIAAAGDDRQPDDEPDAACCFANKVAEPTPAPLLFHFLFDLVVHRLKLGSFSVGPSFGHSAA